MTGGIALHQLTEAGERIKYLIENDELAAEGFQQALDDIKGEINAKIVGCGMVYRNLEAEAGVYDAEAQWLAAKATAFRNRAEWLRNYVETNARDAGIREVNAGTFKGKWRKLPDLVVVEDAGVLPKSVQRHIPETWEPDKRLLLQMMQANVPVKGAHLLKEREKWVFV